MERTGWLLVPLPSKSRTATFIDRYKASANSMRCDRRRKRSLAISGTNDQRVIVVLTFSLAADLRPSESARRYWHQSPSCRRFASARIPVSISSSVLGLPVHFSIPNTSAGLVSSNTDAGLSKTPSGVFSTVSFVPGCHPSDCRIGRGRTIWPVAETMVVNRSLTDMATT